MKILTNLSVFLLRECAKKRLFFLYTDTTEIFFFDVLTFHPKGIHYLGLFFDCKPLFAHKIEKVKDLFCENSPGEDGKIWPKKRLELSGNYSVLGSEMQFMIEWASRWPKDTVRANETWTAWWIFPKLNSYKITTKKPQIMSTNSRPLPFDL